MPNKSSRSGSSTRATLAVLAAYAVALAITAPVEVGRLRGMESPAGSVSLAAWLVDMNVDTTPYFLLLLVAPLVWLIRRPIVGSTGGLLSRCLGPETKPQAGGGRGGRCAWLLAALVSVASVGTSAWISHQRVGGAEGPRFGDLPPAYHDEYSYLFQAKTFLAGRTWFPSHPAAAELFDQMHVLNDNGKFASRYFPGAGVWMAPFVALGGPYWGQWLAGALTAVFVFWAGRELGGNGTGFLAGMLTAVSPGMGLFSNLLLAHHPTLAGLSLFTFAFLRMMRTARWWDAVWAGAGLSFAMLCRPMTAAGIGLPFGLWFAWWMIRGGMGNPAHAPGLRLRVTTALVVPLLSGFVLLFLFDRSITGNGWTTPYSLYTATYTPRHVYGFNNKVRGERHAAPKVLENYDRWAENLDGRLALENVKRRLIASWQWTLGIVPLAMASVLFVGIGPEDRRAWLLPSAIVSLHAAHVPYWFSGIMNWHYVFESGPFWLLVTAVATQAVCRHWRETNRSWMAGWWIGMICIAPATAYLTPEPFWGVSRLHAGVEEVAFSRLRYAEFRRLIRERLGSARAIVLVDADPADRHIDYVVNDPQLDGDVLIGRMKPGETDPARVAEFFPDREVYVFRQRGVDRRLTRWRPAGGGSRPAH